MSVCTQTVYTNTRSRYTFSVRDYHLLPLLCLKRCKGIVTPIVKRRGVFEFRKCDEIRSMSFNASWNVRFIISEIVLVLRRFVFRDVNQRDNSVTRQPNERFSGLHKLLPKLLYRVGCFARCARMEYADVGMYVMQLLQDRLELLVVKLSF